MKKLESLEAWKVGREVACDAYRLTLNKPLSSHFGLADQVRRAAVSIPANIAEGFGLSTTPQLIKFLRISLGSTYEMMCHLYLLGELDLVDTEALENLHAKVDRLIGLLIGLLRSLGARVPG